jgi:hypothetical protein
LTHGVPASFGFAVMTWCGSLHLVVTWGICWW